VDVYSLGVILFRMLAGALPFSGLSLYEKMLGSTKAQRPSLFAKRPDLARDADEWVALALAIDPEQRFRNVRALWNAFLTTFHVEPPERGKRGRSLWAKAAGRVKELAGVPDSARSADPVVSSAPARAWAEPSFVTQALARSVAPRNEPASPAESSSSDERTVELTAEPPAEATLPERTLELAKPPVPSAPEKTLELSGADLLVEDTLPDPALADTLPEGARTQVTRPPRARRAPPASTKSRRGAKSKGRGRGKRGKKARKRSPKRGR
jgi:serine/threonine protein kinase